MRKAGKSFVLTMLIVLLAGVAAYGDDCMRSCRRMKTKEEMRTCVLECKRIADENAAAEEAKRKEEEARLAEEARKEEARKKAEAAKFVKPEEVIAWKQIYEMEGDQYGIDIISSSGGGYYVAGHFRETRYANTEALLMTIGDTGEMKKMRTYDVADSSSYIRSIAEIKDGAVLIGIELIYPPDNYSNILLLEVGPDMEIRRENEIGEANLDDDIQAIMPTEEGGYVIGGMANSFADYKNSLFIGKMDAEDKAAWLKKAGTAESRDVIMSLRPASGGGLLATGDIGNPEYTDMVVYKITAGGDQEWRFMYGGSRTDFGRDAIEVADGQYLAVGKIDKKGDYDERGMLVKFDDSLNVIWERSYYFGQKDWGDPLSVVKTGDGNYLVCGGIYVDVPGRDTDSDGLVFKVDPDGNLLWFTLLDENRSFERLYKCIPGNDGGVIAVGKTGNEKNSIFTVKIDDSGIAGN